MNKVIKINSEKSSLAEMVHQQIRSDIYDLHLLPGERYTEANLALRYKVSRTPLRLALHMLKREGFLNKGNGHAAWQIPPIDLDYFQDLYELRVNLELIAIRRICTLETPPDFSSLKNFWFVSEADRRPGDVPACYAQASLARTRLGWNAKHNLDDMCRDAWKWQKMSSHQNI